MSIIALTLTRALGRENVDVVRVHPNLFDYSLSSKYCTAVEICPNLYESEDSLTDFLNDLSSRYPGKKVLIPASDDCSLFLARHEDKLSKEFILLNPSASTMRWVKNKRLQYELAAATNVPIPETYFPECQEDVLELSKSLADYPYIIKPLEAQKWRLSNYSGVANGKKAITVHTAREMLAEYQRISPHDKDIMIQEIISGRDDKLFTFLGYCSDEHKPLAYCIRKKIRQNPVDFGYCTSTVSCHNDQIDEYARRLLEHSDYRGIVGIEFKYDSKTDSYKLIEVNTRSVNTTGLSIGCGVNLPYIAYSDAIGEEPEPTTDWQDGVTWVRLHEDFSAARKLRRRGELTYFQWLKSIGGKRTHAVYSSDDVRPFSQYYYWYLKQLLSRVLRIGSVSEAARGNRSGQRRATSRLK